MTISKKWNAILMRENHEKKVIKQLFKLKIELFFPVCSLQKDALRKHHLSEQQALFPSTIFVHIPECHLPEIGRIKDVTGLLYWLNKPAAINDREIATIAECLRVYETICVEKSEMGVFSEKEKHNFLSTIDQNMRIHLPTLGYTIVASPAIKQHSILSQEKDHFYFQDLSFIKENTL